MTDTNPIAIIDGTPMEIINNGHLDCFTPSEEHILGAWNPNSRSYRCVWCGTEAVVATVKSDKTCTVCGEQTNPRGAVSMTKGKPCCSSRCRDRVLAAS